MDYRTLAKDVLNARIRLSQKVCNAEVFKFSRGEMTLLKTLIDSKENVYPKDLMKKLDVTSARIASLLNQMERKEWIERETDKKDNRKTIIKITEKGKQIYLNKENEILDYIIKILKKLGPDDAQDYFRLQHMISQM